MFFQGPYVLLIHGRYVEAKGWRDLMWGDPATGRLGNFTKVIEYGLRAYRAHEKLACVIFGSGASERDDLKEAQVMKYELYQSWREMLPKFPELWAEAVECFPELATSNPACDLPSILFGDIICEITSQNTMTEIVATSQIAVQHGAKTVFHIMAASHMPRCALTYLQLREAGKIPHDLEWHGIPDDMAFIGTKLTDVVVLEPPHRGDDPMMGEELTPATLMKQFFTTKMTSAQRKECLAAMRTVIFSYVMSR